MPQLIVLAEPRSCSTYFMSQFVRSPVLDVCKNYHYELINPRDRQATRDYLWLEPANNVSAWDRDSEYVDKFLAKNKNAAFKTIVCGHGREYIHYLSELPATFVTLRRMDEASSMASIISRMTRQSWYQSSRVDPIQFRGTGKLYGNGFTDYRYLDIVYWTIIQKSKSLFDLFPEAINITTEELHPEYHHHELEKQFQMKFDLIDYTTPSHYRETFVDWEYYEEVVRHVLGDIPGL